LLSIIVGGLMFIITKNTFAYISGFCFFIITSIIRQQIIIEKNTDLILKLNSFVDSIKISDGFEEILLLYHIKKIGKIRENIIEVDKSEVFQFWYDGVSRVHSSCKILSYASPKETWNLGWQKIAIGIQQERIISGCKIERIFVIDSSENLEDYSNINFELENIGVIVKFVYKNWLSESKLIKQYFKEIGTYDFSISDNKWIRRNYLLKNRSISKADAVNKKELVSKAKMLFHEAQKLGKTFDEISMTSTLP